MDYLFTFSGYLPCYCPAFVTGQCAEKLFFPFKIFNHLVSCHWLIFIPFFFRNDSGIFFVWHIIIILGSIHKQYSMKELKRSSLVFIEVPLLVRFLCTI